MGRLAITVLVVALTTACATVEDDRPGTRAGWSMAGTPLNTCSPLTGTRPSLKTGKAPIYPVKRLMLKQDGYALLEFDVSPEGKASRFESIEYSHPSFYAHAKAAITDWTFEPAMDSGVPVTVRCRYRQNFRISGDRRRQ